MVHSVAVPANVALLNVTLEMLVDCKIIANIVGWTCSSVLIARDAKRMGFFVCYIQLQQNSMRLATTADFIFLQVCDNFLARPGFKSNTKEILNSYSFSSIKK